MSRVVSWRDLVMQAEGKGFHARNPAYVFTNRVFTEPAEVVYGEIDLYPSNILYPDEVLFPVGDD